MTFPHPLTAWFWLLYFWLFLKASLFSTSGLGSLPSLHADLLARRLASDRQFAEALTIGQLSPGPNGLWVVSLGYLTAGLPGSLLALLALTLPPLLILAIERGYRRVRSCPQRNPAFRRAKPPHRRHCLRGSGSFPDPPRPFVRHYRPRRSCRGAMALKNLLRIMFQTLDI